MFDYLLCASLYRLSTSVCWKPCLFWRVMSELLLWFVYGKNAFLHPKVNGVPVAKIKFGNYLIQVITNRRK